MNKIFYFSATGNSKFVAERILEEFSGQLIDVGREASSHSFVMEKEDICFLVFPVYFNNLPKVFQRFLNDLELKDEKGQAFEGQVVCVATHGGMPGAIDNQVKKALKKIGLSLTACYEIEMVDNFIPMFKIPLLEEQIMKNRRGERQLKEAITSMKFNHRLPYKSSMSMRLIAAPLKGAYSMMSKTKKFYSTDLCNGCSLCERACPDRVIEMVDGRPKWKKDSCTFCMGCLHRCPQRAIEYGKSTIGKERYVNIRTKL